MPPALVLKSTLEDAENKRKIRSLLAHIKHNASCIGLHNPCAPKYFRVHVSPEYSVDNQRSMSGHDIPNHRAATRGVRDIRSVESLQLRINADDFGAWLDFMRGTHVR
jgi:hypothetical protein